MCDFAEVYHIYDYRALRPSYAAALACGLGEGSRIKRAISGATLTTAEILLAGILDNMKLLVWAQTADGAKGRNRPKSVLEVLTRKKPTQGGYASAAEFEAARQVILEGSE